MEGDGRCGGGRKIGRKQQKGKDSVMEAGESSKKAGWL